MKKMIIKLIGIVLLILKCTLLILAILLFNSVALAQRNSIPSKAELAEITERGRQLAEYDVAAWHATDAVLAMKPEKGSFARYLAKKVDNGWTVAFGRFNEKRDKFLIVYEANPGTSPKEFNVKRYDPPKEDIGLYFSAAKAIETVLTDFRGENRPYNVATLPAKLGQMYVYFIPAQTKQGVYPLGGDVRYMVSEDGSKIVEKRQLHKCIIEYCETPPKDKKMAIPIHFAVLDDIPEDTDVFHVLSRKPSLPQWVLTQQYVYRIATDGTINYVMPSKEFMKKGPYDLHILELNMVIEINPRDAETYTNRGRVYYFKGEYDKSWEDFKKAQDLGYKIPPEFLDDLRKASGRQD